MMRTAFAPQPYGLRDLLTIVFYHKRAMLSAFLLPVLLAVAAAAITRPVYVAQARLLVLYGSEYFYRPAAGQPNANIALDRNEIMLGELQVLQSTTLAVETLKAVGVDRVYPGTPTDNPLALDRAAIRMASDLTLTSVAQSNILELSFRNRNADIAAQVLRTLIDTYLKRRTEVFQHPRSESVQVEQSNFLDRLRAAERALAAFAELHDISSLDQQLNLLVQQQSRDSQARNETAQQVTETSARLAAVQQRLDQLPQTIQTYDETNRSQQSQLLTDTLLRLQARRRELASRYTESFPQLPALDQQIAAAKADLARAPVREGAITRDGLNPTYQDVQNQALTLNAQLQGLRAKAEQIDRAADATSERIKEINRSAVQYRDLQRNRDVLDETYRTFVRNNEEAQITDTAERNRAANIRVVQPPERPVVSRDLRKVLVAVGVVVGLIAAVAALAVCNALRQVFISIRDAAVALQLPVLASVANRQAGSAKAARRRRAEKSAKPSDAPLAGHKPNDARPDMAARMHDALAPRLMSLEAADGLVHRLRRNARPAGIIVQMIAARTGEGTSSLARDLALIAARTAGSRVLLLDLGLPGNTQMQALCSELGTDITSTRPLPRLASDVVVHQLGIGTLYVTEIRGRLRPGLSECADLFPKLRAEFDLVVIDSPSIDQAHDGIILAPDVTMSLLVVEAEKTRAAIARNLRDRILTTGGTIEGIILNKRRFHIPAFVYRHV